MAGSSGKIKFRDLPELSPNRFRLGNSMGFCHVPTPQWFNRDGTLSIQDGWMIVGKCENMDEQVMVGRKDWIGLMLFREDEGEMWMHYPLIDEDMRAHQILVGKLV